MLNEAQLDLAKTTLARYQALDKTTPGAVSEQALDQYKAAVVEAKARVDAQKKSLEVYKLNKEFTHVVSPIDGQVSRYYLTLGNLVNQDQTLLTTIVSLDPMYVYFDMDESHLVADPQGDRGRQDRGAGGRRPPGAGWGCKTRTASRTKRPINFVNNQVNSTTGSITMRGVFREPQADLPAGQGLPSAGGSARRLSSAAPSAGSRCRGGRRQRRRQFVPRLFSPGMFVRVRLPIGQPHQALLIIDRAIQSDQGLKYVYVLDAQNKVQTRSIKTGALQEDGLRVVEGEIKPDDWVVVGAIQQVRAANGSQAGPQADAVAGRASRGCAAGGRRSKARCRAAKRRIEAAFMISRFFIDRPIFATVLSVVITLDRRDRAAFPAGRPVPADHAARREHLDQLSRRQRPGRGRHGRRAHRAAGQRRRGHALHVVAIGQRRHVLA